MENQLPWKPTKTSIIDFTSFLPLMDSPNGLLKLKVVESAVLEIMGGGGLAQPPLPAPLFRSELQVMVNAGLQGVVPGWSLPYL